MTGCIVCRGDYNVPPLCITCPIGYFLLNGVCTICDFPCLTCITSATNCITCSGAYRLLPQCICNVGYYDYDGTCEIC